jgi:hypothetical protein
MQLHESELPRPEWESQKEFVQWVRDMPDDTFKRVMAVVNAAENAARKNFVDYDEACEHHEKNRMEELASAYPDDDPEAIAFARQYGLKTPAQLREAILDQDRVEHVARSLREGECPARRYYRLAHEGGYQPHPKVLAKEAERMEHLAEQDPEKYDEEWNRLAALGRLGT